MATFGIAASTFPLSTTFSCVRKGNVAGRFPGGGRWPNSGLLHVQIPGSRVRKMPLTVSRTSPQGEREQTGPPTDSVSNGKSTANGKSNAKFYETANGKSTGDDTGNDDTPTVDRKSRERESIPGLRWTVWDQQDLSTTYPKLRKYVRADVVVVGAGIAGLSVAYNLAKAGKKVVVLEARCIGAGQTGRTTAHLMPWNDDYFMHLEQLFGQENAFLVGDSHRKAIDWVERVVKEEHIHCEFKRVDAYLFPHDDKQSTIEMLVNEYKAVKRAGFHDASLVDLGRDPSLGSIETAIKFPSAADFHPLKYILGLARAIKRMGGEIYEESRVTKQEGSTVYTTDNYWVSGNSVVLATNSPINHNLAIHSRQPADRTYVIGMEVKKGEIKQCQWWDTYSPYHYVRIEEKDGHDILIVGGEDHPTGVLSPSEYPFAYSNLEKWAKKRWPAAGKVVYWWTGQVYKPVDSLGLYHHDHLNFSNTYIATGDSGQGMTGGTIAGLILSDLIFERKNRWEHLYDTYRLPPPHPSVLQNFADAAFHTAQGYAQNLPGVGNDCVSIAMMHKKSGAILNQGVEKVAVYKDEKGIAHKFSAVCPHLKCVVKWNPKDRTFDCPCHGSQFDTQGRCIQGPAKESLPPVA